MMNKGGFEAFRQALGELGHVEGQTSVLEARWAEGRIARIPELVAELIGLKVDVLVKVSTTAALAVKNATQTIPIVVIVTDPVGFDLGNWDNLPSIVETAPTMSAASARSAIKCVE
jgi:putative tryptophan/tyrosine transport system substrate-binding protein